MSSIYGGVPALSKADIKVLSEAVQKGVFNKPSLQQIYGVRTGIKGQTRLGILGNYTGLSGFNKTGCDLSDAPGTIQISDKTWNPKYVSDRFELCYDDLMGSFLQWLLANGLAKENLQNSTDLLNYSTEMLSDAIVEALHRMIVFGDTAMVAGTNNSVASGSAKYFTPFDGWWKQAVAIGAATPKHRITVTKNSAGTYALQAFDSTDVANGVVTGYFNAAYKQADYRMRDMPKDQLVYIATASMVDQYVDERKAKTSIDLAYNRVENGMDTVMFNGIEVVQYSLMDRMIATYFDNAATSNYNPHRAILTTRKNAANILIGTEDEKNLYELDAFYDKYQKKMVWEYGFMADCKVAIDEKVVVIY